MSLFSGRVAYDRTRIMDAAARARAKRRRRRAIRLYRRVLAVEPNSVDLHLRLAPLLAETRQAFDAWQSYHRAGAALARVGQLDKALAVYKDAARRLPRRVEAWRQAAHLECKLQRPRDAVETLLEGRRHFRGRRRRAEAIYLLRRAVEIDPGHRRAVCDLARLLARADQEAEAQALLERLAAQVHGVDLRRVRGVLWRIEPSLRNTWQWLRAALAAARAEPGLEAS